MTKYRLILVGDRSLVLSGLSSMLESDHLAVIGTAASSELPELLRSSGERPDVVLWDGSTNLEEDFLRCTQIGREFPDIDIVVLTEEVDEVSTSCALPVNVRGLLPRAISIGGLKLSLQLIALGEDLFAIPCSLVGAWQACSAAPRATTAAELRIALSSREAQILQRLGAGLPNKAIARELGVAEGTVKVHVKSAFRKISVNNRTQAALWVMNNL